MNADGTNRVKLTRDGDSHPSWSPDGTKIAFTHRDGNDEIYIIDADGKNAVNLTNHKERDYLPSWSPDGKQIIFTSSRDGNDEIYVMDADGKNPVNLTFHRGRDYWPSWSPIP
jgi:Tol biopolymer transport system component